MKKILITIFTILNILIILSSCIQPNIETSIQTPASKITETPFPTLSELETTYTFTPKPSATLSNTIGEKPPTCTFPLDQTTATESIPENYVFSEPHVVLADPNNGFNILAWLPDNQRALIMQDVIESQYVKYQSIELFDSRKINLQVYAKRAPTYAQPPLWISSLNAIIYPEILLVSSSYDENGVVIRSSVVLRYLLWLNDGDIDNVQSLEDKKISLEDEPHEWVVTSLAVNPNGSQLIYLKSAGKQLYQLYSRKVSQGILEAEQQLPFDVTKWNYRLTAEATPLPLKMEWRPNTSQIFLYTDKDWSAGYTFLMDINTNEICELNLDGWALLGRWSANGRYLAIVRAVGDTHGYTDLAVLDTLTGELHGMQVVPKEFQGRHYVSDITWAPDNYHLLVVGKAISYSQCFPNCWENTRLYLVDFLNKQTNDILPSSNQFISNFAGTSLAWSPDGTKILALCPAICLISVEKKVQP